MCNHFTVVGQIFEFPVDVGIDQVGIPPVDLAELTVAHLYVSKS